MSPPVLVDLGAVLGLFGSLVVVELHTSPALAVALEVQLQPEAAGAVAHVLLEGRPIRRVQVGLA